jgi:hypothetical protein
LPELLGVLPPPPCGGWRLHSLASRSTVLCGRDWWEAAWVRASDRCRWQSDARDDGEVLRAAVLRSQHVDRGRGVCIAVHVWGRNSQQIATGQLRCTVEQLHNAVFEQQLRNLWRRQLHRHLPLQVRRCTRTSATCRHGVVAVMRERAVGRAPNQRRQLRV